MKKILCFALLLVAVNCFAPPPTSTVPPATQAEVDAGLIKNKYVSPATLGLWAGAGTNATPLVTISNIANGAVQTAIPRTNFGYRTFYTHQYVATPGNEEFANPLILGENSFTNIATNAYEVQIFGSGNATGIASNSARIYAFGSYNMYSSTALLDRVVVVGGDNFKGTTNIGGSGTVGLGFELLGGEDSYIENAIVSGYSVGASLKDARYIDWAGTGIGGNGPFGTSPIHSEHTFLRGYQSTVADNITNAWVFGMYGYGHESDTFNIGGHYHWTPTLYLGAGGASYPDQKAYFAASGSLTNTGGSGRGRLAGGYSRGLAVGGDVGLSLAQPGAAANNKNAWSDAMVISPETNHIVFAVTNNFVGELLGLIGTNVYTNNGSWVFRDSIGHYLTNNGNYWEWRSETGDIFQTNASLIGAYSDTTFPTNKGVASWQWVGNAQFNGTIAGNGSGVTNLNGANIAAATVLSNKLGFAVDAGLVHSQSGFGTNLSLFGSSTTNYGNIEGTSDGTNATWRIESQFGGAQFGNGVQAVYFRGDGSLLTNLNVSGLTNYPTLAQVTAAGNSTTGAVYALSATVSNLTVTVGSDIGTANVDTLNLQGGILQTNDSVDNFFHARTNYFYGEVQFFSNSIHFYDSLNGGEIAIGTNHSAATITVGSSVQPSIALWDLSSQKIWGLKHNTYEGSDGILSLTFGDLNGSEKFLIINPTNHVIDVGSNSVVTTGTNTAGYFVGSGALLTDLPGSDLTAATNNDNVVAANLTGHVALATSTLLATNGDCSGLTGTLASTVVPANFLRTISGVVSNMATNAVSPAGGRLWLSDSGKRLVAFGAGALATGLTNPAANDVVALGYLAGQNISGNAQSVIGLGSYAANQNTSGSYNLAIGNYALRNNKTANYIIAIGNNCLTAVTNSDGLSTIGIGQWAGQSNLWVHGSIMIGESACASATNVNNTVALGNNTLQLGTNVHHCAVGGDYAGQYYQDGYATLWGYKAGWKTVAGANLNVFGCEAAMYSQGNNILAVGNFSAIGDIAETNRMSTVDSDCVFVGIRASRSGSINSWDPLTNSVALGNNSTFSQNNEVRLGNDWTANVNTTGAINASNTVKAVNGFIVSSNSWAAPIPAMAEGDNLYRSSNGIPHVIVVLGGATNIYRLIP